MCLSKPNTRIIFLFQSCAGFSGGLDDSFQRLSYLSFKPTRGSANPLGEGFELKPTRVRLKVKREDESTSEFFFKPTRVRLKVYVDIVRQSSSSPLQTHEGFG